MHTNRIDTCGKPIGEVDAGNHSASVSNDLLCCPFCGAKAMVEDKHPILPTGERDTFYRVECLAPDCNARTNWWYPEIAAIQAWNRRAT